MVRMYVTLIKIYAVEHTTLDNVSVMHFYFLPFNHTSILKAFTKATLRPNSGCPDLSEKI